jgi:hypothetical protein
MTVIIVGEDMKFGLQLQIVRTYYPFYEDRNLNTQEILQLYA